MTPSDHWTIGPVADRVGIILVGMSMVVPLITLVVALWRQK